MCVCACLPATRFVHLQSLTHLTQPFLPLPVAWLPAAAGACVAVLLAWVGGADVGGGGLGEARMPPRCLCFACR